MFLFSILECISKLLCSFCNLASVHRFIHRHSFFLTNTSKPVTSPPLLSPNPPPFLSSPLLSSSFLFSALLIFPLLFSPPPSFYSLLLFLFLSLQPSIPSDQLLNFLCGAERENLAASFQKFFDQLILESSSSSSAVVPIEEEEEAVEKKSEGAVEGKEIDLKGKGM